MSIHINKFVDRIRSTESRGNKDFVMSMADAKDLHADITRLLLDLQSLREGPAKSTTEPVVQVKMDGGSFK